MTLKNIKIGKKAEIIKINSSGALRRRLMDMGLTRGCIVKIRRKAPFGDPIQINIRGYELTLRLAEAEKIEVKKCP